MKFSSKSTESFKIVEVKSGTGSNGLEWFLVKVENADGKLNLLCNGFNFPRFAENVGKRCRLILEYEESYVYSMKKKHTALTLKDIELLE